MLEVKLKEGGKKQKRKGVEVRQKVKEAKGRGLGGRRGRGRRQDQREQGERRQKANK